MRQDIVCVFFFFSSRRRHTRFKCDWSSDVCSSDLTVRLGLWRYLFVALDREATNGTPHSEYPQRLRQNEMGQPPCTNGLSPCPMQRIVRTPCWESRRRFLGLTILACRILLYRFTDHSAARR